ncbi:MAG: 50S ribosomal protein L4 [Candidatus Marsarchaeota archaeon]|nr:50S ribosomal protein L4 [Candidatus Marsarchaeota archaeon]
MNVYGLDGKVEKSIELPKVFSGEWRGDIVRRALLSEQSRDYQPQGHFLLAGLQTTAVYVGKYSAAYRRGRHMGIAIRPRQKLGGGAQGDVRRIPSAVKGHRATPHRIEKRIEELINNKEYAAAIRSAIAGSSNATAVKSRHSTNATEFPIIVDNKLEEIRKARDLAKVLMALGLKDDLDRSHKPRLRKGLKRSGRSRHFRNSVLIVSKSADTVAKAGSNIPGVDVCSLNELTIRKLAPGALPRMSIWTEAAIAGVEEATTNEAIKSRKNR